jgi:peptidoglycan/xylan/chitin deacetylase (PgdA/CDA1 family)
MGDRLEGWRAAHARGHEMADHTVSHPCHLRHASTGAYVRREIAPMEAFLDRSFGPARTKLFAYPCDNTELGEGDQVRREARYAKLVSQAFVAARTRLALRYLKRAMAEHRWAILIFHEILPSRRGAGDTSIATHAAILDWIAAQPLWCAPMGEVLGSLISPSLTRA